MTKKHTIEFVKSFFKNQGCKLLSKKYEGVDKKLDYICSCGNKSSISFHNFKAGYRCKKCGYKRLSRLLKGRNISKEWKQKMKQNHFTKNKEYSPSNHPRFKKDDNISYTQFHKWVRDNKPKPKFCELCGKEKDYLGKTKLELANIKNHNYSRNPDDYKWSHHSCHFKFDKNGKCNGEFICRDCQLDIDNSDEIAEAKFCYGEN